MCSYCGYPSSKGHIAQSATHGIQREMTARPAPSSFQTGHSPSKFEKELSGTITTSSPPLPTSSPRQTSPDHDRCESSIGPVFWVIIVAVLVILIWAVVSSIS